MDAAIDITSLIDATFILIIFLLISTTFKKKEYAFSIALPNAASEEVVIEVERTSVYVTKEGDFFLLELTPNAPTPTDDTAKQRGKPMKPDALQAYLQNRVKTEADFQASILAEKDTDYQHIIDVLDIIRASGVQGVQLPYDFVPGAQ